MDILNKLAIQSHELWADMSLRSYQRRLDTPHLSGFRSTLRGSHQVQVPESIHESDTAEEEDEDGKRGTSVSNIVTTPARAMSVSRKDSAQSDADETNSVVGFASTGSVSTQIRKRDRVHSKSGIDPGGSLGSEHEFHGHTSDTAASPALRPLSVRSSASSPSSATSSLSMTQPPHLSTETRPVVIVPYIELPSNIQAQHIEDAAEVLRTLQSSGFMLKRKIMSSLPVRKQKKRNPPPALPPRTIKSTASDPTAASSSGASTSSTSSSSSSTSSTSLSSSALSSLSSSSNQSSTPFTPQLPTIEASIHSDENQSESDSEYESEDVLPPPPPSLADSNSVLE